MLYPSSYNIYRPDDESDTSLSELGCVLVEVKCVSSGRLRIVCLREEEVGEKERERRGERVKGMCEGVWGSGERGMEGLGRIGGKGGGKTYWMRHEQG